MRSLGIPSNRIESSLDPLLVIHATMTLVSGRRAPAGRRARACVRGNDVLGTGAVRDFGVVRGSIKSRTNNRVSGQPPGCLDLARHRDQGHQHVPAVIIMTGKISEGSISE
jgi:hypothetical protein